MNVGDGESEMGKLTLVESSEDPRSNSVEGPGGSRDPNQPVHNVKSGPQAKPDTASGAENGLVAIDVMANDSGGNGKHLWSLDQTGSALYTAPGAITTLPSGARSWIDGGMVVYHPGDGADHLAKGQEATDTFAYAIRMSNGVISYATVTVTTIGSNDGPVANPDLEQGGEHRILFLDALANDMDPDAGASLSIVSATAPAGNGLVSIIENQIKFDLRSDFDHLAEGETATISIDYTIADEYGAEASSTVTISIIGSNDAPVISGAVDAGSVDEDAAPVAIDLLDNASDAAGDPLSVSGITITDPDGNAVAFTDNGNGTITIDPAQRKRRARHLSARAHSPVQPANCATRARKGSPRSMAIWTADFQIDLTRPVPLQSTDFVL